MKFDIKINENTAIEKASCKKCGSDDVTITTEGNQEHDGENNYVEWVTYYKCNNCGNNDYSAY